MVVVSFNIGQFLVKTGRYSEGNLKVSDVFDKSYVVEFVIQKGVRYSYFSERGMLEGYRTDF